MPLSTGDVTIRPLASPTGPILALNTTALSSGVASNGRTLALGSAHRGVSAQVSYSTGPATLESTAIEVAFDGSLNPDSGWTELKSTTWNSTADGLVRLIQDPNSTGVVPVSYLRARVVGLTSQASTVGHDVQIWLGVVQ